MNSDRKDPAFLPNRAGLERALEILLRATQDGAQKLPDTLPLHGIGENDTLDFLAPFVLGQAQSLGADTNFAHMDPPTPWITWAIAQWSACLNQNLLHPDLSPVATQIEARVLDWLAPYYGMNGGHFTPGSSVANLTAIWAAREVRGITSVVASDMAHISVAKAAHLLSLEYISVKTNAYGEIDSKHLPKDLSTSALVLTAGTTSTGAIDDLNLIGRAAWSHVDAAWTGPMRLSQKYAPLLDGIDAADSVAISAHKWFFQAKSSGLILFKNNEAAKPAISFGGAYLATPNVGVLGSRGADAIPLFATLLAWGQTGMAARIDRAMALADRFWQYLDQHPQIKLFGPQTCGVILWRPLNGDNPRVFLQKLPVGSTSLTTINDQVWLRNVAANPNADIDQLWDKIRNLLTTK